MDDLLDICDDGCLDETEGIFQRIWSKKRRRMPCELAAVGLWYGGTLLAVCSRFIAMELTAKKYLQNKAPEIRTECCLDETQGILERIWSKKSLVSLMLCDMVRGPCLQFADFIAMEYDGKNMLHNKV
jgi:hypothetical protein